MVPPDLVAYIREQSAAGISAEELRVALMEAGWHEHDVENALHDVAAGLEPLTTGASLHEDVAQVRGLVAHLASRVQRLETRLGAAPAPAMPAMLPSATIGPERELRAGRTFGTKRIFSAAVAFAGLAVFGYAFQLLVERSQQAPMAFLQVAGLIGLLGILGAWILMRRGSAWPAQLVSASAVAVWALTVWHAWRTYHYMETTTAAALGLLLLVLLLVMGRWIDRYAGR